jgi:hypothetical protein
MTCEWCGDIGPLLSGIGTLIVAEAAVPAVAGIRRARRLEAARWIDGLFRDLYLDGNYGGIRARIEYRFADLGPLLERRITNRELAVTEEETQLLGEVDKLLKHLEFALFLERNSLLRRSDRDALLGYWFEVLREPERSAIRRYADHFSWTRLAAELNRGQPRNGRFEYLAVRNDQQDLAEAVEQLGERFARVQDGATGALGDCAEHTIYEVADTTAFAALDRAVCDEPISSMTQAVKRHTTALNCAGGSLDVWQYARAVTSRPRPDRPGRRAPPRMPPS